MTLEYNRHWQVLPWLEAPGAVQMAIDEWLLEQHRVGHMPPILRFYGWSRPTLSLGYHQHHWPHHWSYLTWQGQQLDLVRRPSGGRAVLHQGDVTYGLILSGLTGRRAETYRFLCQFLIEGWRSLGLPLQFGQAGRGYIHNPNCFGTATAADLVTADGYKLIGSAQLRRDRTILQHGSMRLQPDADLFFQVFQTPLDVTTATRQALNSLQPENIVTTLQQSACEALGITLDPYHLSPEDWSAIQDRAAHYEIAGAIS